ncbi:MAG: phenylalanine--tRNA ligase subunit alpha, partial [Nanoarchaeota archaeon]
EIRPGKKHFVNQATEYANQIWREMGFREMKGNLVNTSFWNFDALFTAQDHPVREMQDTYYLGGKAEKGKLPSAELVKRVKETHENGGKTGSTGWKYSWNEEEAKKNVLRTHTTVLTSQTLAKLKAQDIPVKFFALGKCFRNEALDWCHHFEFNQTEGIVIDEKANFRHLLGYLHEFFRKMGFPQARFRPSYFPYTEPSVEIDVWHPQHQKWVELGGAGMLRPEVVIPLLGRDIPVLAWGPGFDRLILDYYQIKDIRELYKNDLKLSREVKAWLK